MLPATRHHAPRLRPVGPGCGVRRRLRLDRPATMEKVATCAPFVPTKGGRLTATAAPAPPLVRLLTAGEVADAWGVTKERVWELTREGKIPAVRLGGRTYRYHPARLAAAIEDLQI